MTIKAFIADRPGTGAVVFADGNFGWTEYFSDARRFPIDSGLEFLPLIATRAEVTGQGVGTIAVACQTAVEVGARRPAGRHHPASVKA